MKDEFTPLPKSVRHGASALQTDRYSEEVIIECNKLHDARLGWSLEFPSLYLNVKRLPESHFGPASTLWHIPK